MAVTCYHLADWHVYGHISTCLSKLFRVTCQQTSWTLNHTNICWSWSHVSGHLMNVSSVHYIYLSSVLYEKPTCAWSVEKKLTHWGTHISKYVHQAQHHSPVQFMHCGLVEQMISPHLTDLVWAEVSANITVRFKWTISSVRTGMDISGLRCPSQVKQVLHIHSFLVSLHHLSWLLAGRDVCHHFSSPPSHCSVGACFHSSWILFSSLCGLFLKGTHTLSLA